MGMAKYTSFKSTLASQSLSQAIFHSMNTLHFEVLGVDKSVKGFEAYHWSLPSILLGD